jgi:hypothetical protein
VNSKKQVKGIIDIYSSSPYPIQLQMIFINDAFGRNFREVISCWLNEKNLVIQLEGEFSDLTNSVVISFKNQGLFVIFLNNIFNDFAFYDERKRRNIANSYLVGEAKKLFIAVDT